MTETGCLWSLATHPTWESLCTSSPSSLPSRLSTKVLSHLQHESFSNPLKEKKKHRLRMISSSTQQPFAPSSSKEPSSSLVVSRHD
jgi:hypothetical protein